MNFGEARHRHDLRDLNKSIDWFGSHGPFDGNVPQVRYLSSGLAASEGDGIKCDDTKKGVSEIRKVMTVYLSEMQPLKRHRTVHTLNGLKPGSSWIRQMTVQIDQSILFLRCTSLAQRDNDDITAYFAHGMTAVPTSLFRDFFLRKIDKSELGREIKKNMRNIMSEYASQLTPYSMIVIDGGSLLHFTRG